MYNARYHSQCEADWQPPKLAPKKIYVTGSMRNPDVMAVSQALREDGHEVFDDWISPGPAADDEWQAYEKFRGRGFIAAMKGEHVRNVFEFDKGHLDSSDAVVMVLPAGKSAFAEMGYMSRAGVPVYVYVAEEPERFEVMLRFATDFFDDLGALREQLKR